MRRLAFALALFAAAASAQPSSGYDRAAEAYREGRFAEAVRILDAAAETAPDDAEVHYLFARVLNDPRNPERDEGRAGREIDRALALEPDNLVYLVARLEQLRQADPWNTLLELYQLRQRAEAAERILAVDSTNAFGHEELGVQAIYDYYQYRNAIKLPGLDLGPPDAAVAAGDDTGATEALDGSTSSAPVPQAGLGDTGRSGGSTTGNETFYEGAAGRETNDRFDIAALRRRGVAITDFRGPRPERLRPGHRPPPPGLALGPAAPRRLRPPGAAGGALGRVPGHPARTWPRCSSSSPTTPRCGSTTGS